MVIGVGIDMLDISRIVDKLNDEKFMTRIFTKSERRYIEGRGKASAESAAGIFCAKEAFGKATGEGLPIALAFSEVCHDAMGRPFFYLSGRASEKYSGCRIELSITHTGSVAVAVVVIDETEARGSD